MKCAYVDRNRIGDHIWYISDVSKFRRHYPDWSYKYNLVDILKQIYLQQAEVQGVINI